LVARRVFQPILLRHCCDSRIK